MRSELAPLRRPLGLRRAAAVGEACYAGRIGRVEIAAAQIGVGPAAAQRATEQMLDAGPVERVVVVGIAGGVAADARIGDLVVPERVVDLASGAAWRPTPLGDVAPRGALVTSDGLITDPEVFARLRREGVVAIDMETAAVAEVCARRGCAWSVFRGISDRVGDAAIDPAVAALAGEDGTPDLRAVLRLVLAQPWRIPQLARLGRDMRRATRTAASAAVRALERL